MLLTDEEIRDIEVPCIKGKCPLNIADTPANEVRDDTCEVCEDKAIAKAQLKKVVEWLDTDCTEHSRVSDSYGKKYFDSHSDCPECWQALLEEVK